MRRTAAPGCNLGEVRFRVRVEFPPNPPPATEVSRSPAGGPAAAGLGAGARAGFLRTAAAVQVLLCVCVVRRCRERWAQPVGGDTVQLQEMTSMRLHHAQERVLGLGLAFL